METAGGGMYNDLGESDCSSNESIIYRENVIDKIDEADEKQNKEQIKPSTEYDKINLDALEVYDEVKELFTFVTDFNPGDIELQTKWKIFVPEYIPSCGDIDAFIKVENEKSDKSLGIKVLDEPSTKQSDPSVVELRMTTLMKQTRVKSATSVKKISNDENFEKLIDKWVADLAEVGVSKPTAVVTYRNPMPEVSKVLEVSIWPGHPL